MHRTAQLISARRAVALGPRRGGSGALPLAFLRLESGRSRCIKFPVFYWKLHKSSWKISPNINAASSYTQCYLRKFLAMIYRNIQAKSTTHQLVSSHSFPLVSTILMILTDLVANKVSLNYFFPLHRKLVLSFNSIKYSSLIPNMYN